MKESFPKCHRLYNAIQGYTWQFIPMDNPVLIKVIDGQGNGQIMALDNARGQYRYLVKEQGYEVV